MKVKPNVVFLIMLLSMTLVGGIAVSGVLFSSRTIPTSGTVKAINVELYWDFNCTLVVTEIDWGLTEPGSTVNKTFYIKNSGNAPLTLNMTYGYWEPENAGEFLYLTWDQEGTIIEAGGKVETLLTLHIPEHTTGVMDFTVDIEIEGKG